MKKTKTSCLFFLWCKLLDQTSHFSLVLSHWWCCLGQSQSGHAVEWARRLVESSQEVFQLWDLWLAAVEWLTDAWGARASSSCCRSAQPTLWRTDCRASTVSFHPTDIPNNVRLPQPPLRIVFLYWQPLIQQTCLGFIWALVHLLRFLFLLFWSCAGITFHSSQRLPEVWKVCSYSAGREHFHQTWPAVQK